MIAYLEGRVLRLPPDAVVVGVGGVGYLVAIPGRLREMLAVGEEVRLHVHTHVREDQLALFGFSSVDEAELFRLLFAVEGLGPRSAMQILSKHTADMVRRAVLANDTKMLQTLPGVGPKTAARIVLDLRSKLGAGIAAPELPETPTAGTVLETLTALGYAQGEVRETLARLDSELDNLTPAQAVATALRALDRR